MTAEEVLGDAQAGGALELARVVVLPREGKDVATMGKGAIMARDHGIKARTSGAVSWR